MGFLLWNSLGYISMLAATRTVASHTQVQYSVPVQCIVIRDEKVIKAPANGEYIPVSPNGTRVRVGQTFARFNGPNGIIELTADRAGLILHGTDGLEGLLPINLLLKDNIADLGRQFLRVKSPGVSSQAEKGQPVAVIIGNAGYQVITNLDFHNEGRKRTIAAEMSDGSVRNLTISPRDVLALESRYWVLWDAPALPDELGLQRAFAAQMITGTQQLVLVPKGALYTKDGERGVFVLYRNKPVFNQVDVLYTQEGWVGVSGLADGQVVLSLPNWASYAKRWWQR